MSSCAQQEAQTKSTPPRSRTVNDFSTEEDLRRGLMSMNIDSCEVDEREQPSLDSCGHPPPPVSIQTNNNAAAAGTATGSAPAYDDYAINEEWDWALTNYDVENTEAQSISQELSRLQVLKSYLVLDSDREEAFERLTNLGSRIFDVPICLISLVDLGRQWFLSNRGLGDVRETPRNLAFCAHAILNNREVFIVPETLTDPRFAESALVVGPPYIRFYAGAPLNSPEGYKLGTFCIIDTKPHPEGLTQEEQDSLIDLAAVTVKTMSDRRELRTQEDPARMIACTAHDLLTPLCGVQLSLHLLQDDQDLHKKLCDHTKELVQTATSSADIMLRICQSTIESLRASNNSTKIKVNTNNKTPTASSPGGFVLDSNNNNGNHNDDGPSVDMQEFTKSLNRIMEPIPKRVPCVISIDKSVPPKILTEDLKIFRSALNLLSNACAATEIGSVHFRIYTKDGQLVFECEDTGKDIDLDDQDCLFGPCDNGRDQRADLGLYSVATQIDGLGGRYGYRPRGIDVNGSKRYDSKGRKMTGSIFWFSIPIILPKNTTSTTQQHASANSSAMEPSSPASVTPPDNTNDNNAAENNKNNGNGKSNNSNNNDSAAIKLSPPNNNKRTLVYTSKIRSLSSSSLSMASEHSRSSLSEYRSDSIISVVAAAAEGISESESFSHRTNCQNFNYKDSQDGSKNKSKSSDASKKALKQALESLGSRVQRTGNVAKLFDIGTPVVEKTSSTSKKGKATKLFGIGNSVSTAKVLAATVKESKTTSPSSACDGGGGARTALSGNVSSSTSTNKSLMKPRKKKALVIEDSVVVRKCLAKALSKLGYDVSEAMNGSVGLRELKKTLFDIVLCDFLMPVMDGLDCVKQFRDWESKSRQTSTSLRQYIVGISAHASKNDIEKGLKIGMDDFKAKPVTIKILTKLHESPEIQQVSSSLDDLHKKKYEKQQQQSSPTLGGGSSSASKAVIDNNNNTTNDDDVEMDNSKPTTTTVAKKDKNKISSMIAADTKSNAPRRHADISSSDLMETVPTSPSSTKDDDVSLGDDDNMIVARPAKRSRLMESANTNNNVEACNQQQVEVSHEANVCLIATDNAASKEVKALMKSMKEDFGWQATIVQDGEDAFRLLKLRNWGAVLVDDDLPKLSGTKCMSRFRDWEAKNRVNRQSNVFLVCTQGIPISTNASSVVQVPSDFDGVLDYPVSSDHFQALLEKVQAAGEKNSLYDASGLAIVTR